MDPATIVRGLAARAGLRPAPISVGFEITHLCNLACSYCDRHTPAPDEMTLEQIRRALGELCDLGMRHVSLDGGEPLAHKSIDDVVALLVSRGVRVFMNTNGILVPRRIETVRRLARVKVSLDGPRACHDAMRGEGSWQKALAGADVAREAGVEVELTCVVGRHNADHLDELLAIADERRLAVVFQPARNSLFLGSERDGAAFQLDARRLREVFARLARRKLDGDGAIANGWASLRHFQRFPDDVALPCAAGWINATMDPEGNLFHCGQVDRSDRSHNVVRLGARAAFEGLTRRGCAQCWCARVVEENHAWGGRLLRMLPPLRLPKAADACAAPLVTLSRRS